MGLLQTKRSVLKTWKALQYNRSIFVSFSCFCTKFTFSATSESFKALFYKAMTMTLTMWCAQLRKEIWRETSYNLHRSLRREYHPSLSVWSPRDLPSGHSEGTVKIPSHVNRSISEGTNRYSVTTCVTMPHHVTSALLTAPPWTHPSPQDEKRPCLMSLVSGWNWETQIFKPLQVCTDQHWGPFGSCLTNTLPCTAKIKRWKTRTLWWCGINQATMTPSFLVSISCGKNGRGCDECSLHVPCISLQSKRVPNCCTDRITFGECRWSFEPKQSSKDHETRGCGANPGMWWLVPLRKFKPWRSHPSLLSHWLAAD